MKMNIKILFLGLIAVFLTGCSSETPAEINRKNIECKDQADQTKDLIKKLSKSSKKRSACTRKVKAFYSPQEEKCVYLSTCNNFRGKNKFFAGELVNIDSKEVLLEISTRDLLEYKDFEDKVKAYKK
jgi:hypothetical protein